MKSNAWRGKNFAEYRAAHPIPFPKGYKGCVAIWCQPSRFERAGAILKKQDDVWAAFGVHPHYQTEWTPEVANYIEERLTHLPQAVAWGEMGLDYNGHRGVESFCPRCTKFARRELTKEEKTKFCAPCQRRVFREQLQRAVRLDKPLVIHSREAEADTLKIMKSFVPSNYPQIHRHCVTVGPDAVADFAQNFPRAKFGFTGVLWGSSKRARDARATVRATPLHRILAETDSPYFGPAEFNKLPGRWRMGNHPGSVARVVETIADLKGLTIKEVGDKLYLNAKEVYGLPLLNPAIC